MALEEKIGELIAAVKENTAALKAGGGSAAASGGAKNPVGRPPKDGAKVTSKHKADDVKAALVGLKEKLGSPAAKQIITETGEAADLADLLTKKDKWDAVMDAVTEALADEGVVEEDDDL